PARGPPGRPPPGPRRRLGEGAPVEDRRTGGRALAPGPDPEARPRRGAADAVGLPGRPDALLRPRPPGVGGPGRRQRAGAGGRAGRRRGGLSRRGPARAADRRRGRPPPPGAPAGRAAARGPAPAGAAAARAPPRPRPPPPHG